MSNDNRRETVSYEIHYFLQPGLTAYQAFFEMFP